MKNRAYKTISIILAFALGAALLSGCSSSMKAIKSNGSPTEGSSLDIVPAASGISSEKVYAMLFFRYFDEDMLASEMRVVSSPSNRDIETIVLEELVKGPSANRQELTPAMPSNVRIMNTSDNQDLLFVTLSREFLDVPANMPEDWQTDEELSRDVMTARRLAVCSIVNTVIQLGQYNRVQILIDEDGTGIGTRLSRAALGFTGEGEDVPIGPLGWQHPPILTPLNLCGKILNYIQSSDWDRLYYYIASEGNEKLSPERLAEEMQALGITFDGYEILNECVFPDGTNAIIELNISYQNADGKTHSRKNITLKLARENGVWKAGHDNIISLFRE